MLFITKVKVSTTLVSLALLVGCADSKTFAGGVPVGAADEQPAVEQTDDGIPAVEKPDVEEPAPIAVTPPKPISTETFNECDKFSDTNMVAKVSEINDIKNSNGETIQSLRHFPFDLEKFFLAKPAVNSTVCLKNLNIGLTEFKNGFPGASNLQEWFALDINFILVAPETGDYFFTMNSDDGSAININGKQLEFRLGTETPRKFLWGMDGHGRGENMGRQANIADGSKELVPAVPTEKITLTKGQKYPVRVQYYQGPKFNIMLDMKWQTPKASAPTTIPLEAILKPAAQ